MTSNSENNVEVRVSLADRVRNILPRRAWAKYLALFVAAIIFVYLLICFVASVSPGATFVVQADRGSCISGDVGGTAPRVDCMQPGAMWDRLTSPLEIGQHFQDAVGGDKASLQATLAGLEQAPRGGASLLGKTIVVSASSLPLPAGEYIVATDDDVSQEAAAIGGVSYARRISGYGPGDVAFTAWVTPSRVRFEFGAYDADLPASVTLDARTLKTVAVTRRPDAEDMSRAVLPNEDPAGQTEQVSTRMRYCNLQIPKPVGKPAGTITVDLIALNPQFANEDEIAISAQAMRNLEALLHQISAARFAISVFQLTPDARDKPSVSRGSCPKDWPCAGVYRLSVPFGSAVANSRTVRESIVALSMTGAGTCSLRDRTSLGEFCRDLAAVKAAIASAVPRTAPGLTVIMGGNYDPVASGIGLAPGTNAAPETISVNTAYVTFPSSELALGHEVAHLLGSQHEIAVDDRIFVDVASGVGASTSRPKTVNLQCDPKAIKCGSQVFASTVSGVFSAYRLNAFSSPSITCEGVALGHSDDQKRTLDARRGSPSENGLAVAESVARSYLQNVRALIRPYEAAVSVPPETPVSAELRIQCPALLVQGRTPNHVGLKEDELLVAYDVGYPRSSGAIKILRKGHASEAKFSPRAPITLFAFASSGGGPDRNLALSYRRAFDGYARLCRSQQPEACSRVRLCMLGEDLQPFKDATPAQRQAVYVSDRQEW